MRFTLPLLFLLACSGDDEADDTTNGSDSAPTTDTADTMSAGNCLELWADARFEPDSTGPDTQIHGTSVFDGEHVWMAWNRPDDGSLFDIWLQRLTCDGQVDVGPLHVTQTDDSELDPVLAVSEGRLMVAWSSDNGQTPDNLDIRTRVFDLDGNPLTEPTDLEAQRRGFPVTGNATLPDLAPREGGFWLAGSWGHDESPAFQAFVVPLDLDGLATDDADDGKLHEEYGQLYVGVAASDDEPRLVWQEDRSGKVLPAIMGGPPEFPTELAAAGMQPDVAYGPSGWWMAWDNGDGDVQVLTPAGDVVTLEPGPELYQHSPSLVVTEEGATVLVMEPTQGFENTLHLRQLNADGDIVHRHPLQAQGAIGAYGADLTAIDDEHVMVVYVEGESPSFRLQSEWLTIP